MRKKSIRSSTATTCCSWTTTSRTNVILLLLLVVVLVLMMLVVDIVIVAAGETTTTTTTTEEEEEQDYSTTTTASVTCKNSITSSDDDDTTAKVCGATSQDSGTHTDTDDNDRRTARQKQQQQQQHIDTMVQNTITYGELQYVPILYEKQQQQDGIDSDADDQQRKKEELELVMKALVRMDTYMKQWNSEKNETNENETNDNSEDDENSLCRNEHESCVFWSAMNECTNNNVYMSTKCGPACQTCEDIIVRNRACSSFIMSSTDDDNNNQNALRQKGDLNHIFENIVSNPYYAASYSKPHILRQPGTLIIPQPWIVVIDNFLSDKECQTLIELGTQQGHKRSLNVGIYNPHNNNCNRSSKGSNSKHGDGITLSSSTTTADTKIKIQPQKPDDGRTSTNAWCVEECYTNPITQRVLHKIENLTGIPDINNEYLQLLKYENGQYSKEHNDYIAHQSNRPQGPRILTVFLYLNGFDDHKKGSSDGDQNDGGGGGGTRFTMLNITVTPRRGRALIWPSVLDRNPNVLESLTCHEALPVKNGFIKYGANAWVHLRDFKTPHKYQCL